MPGTVIPTPSDLIRWRQRTPLSGRDYLLDFRWNARAGRWFLDLLDAQGNVLRAGVMLEVNYPLLRSRTEAMPPGELVCIDTTGQANAPEFRDLGDRVILKYYTQAELAAVRGA